MGLWLRRRKITKPLNYDTVARHKEKMSMVALGCGVALLPIVVMENSPGPVRNRIMSLPLSDTGTPLELGVCVRKKRLGEPLINAFWDLL